MVVGEITGPEGTYPRFMWKVERVDMMHECVFRLVKSSGSPSGRSEESLMRNLDKQRGGQVTVNVSSHRKPES